MRYDKDSGWCIVAAEGEDASRLSQSIKNKEPFSLYMLNPELPKADYVTSRFIAKVGLEILATTCLEIPGWNDEIVDKPELEELRRYVRIGSPNKVWPISIRQIYPPDFLFTDDIQHEPHEKLNEFMIHSIPNESGEEYYAVVAIFGVEYAINLGGPELDGYQKWLNQHKNQSPLFKASPKN